MSWLKNLVGGKRMAALTAGTKAPQFELPSMEGSKFSLTEALTRGPVLAVFFKVSCPVCQYAFPYFQRIYKTYGGDKLTVIGISQNDKKDTAAFMKNFDIAFPVLLDDTKSFPVSNAYGLTNVPTAFWISESVGWLRTEFEEICQKAAFASGDTPKPVFQPAENVADFRAG